MIFDETLTPAQQEEIWAYLTDLDWQAQQKELEGRRGRVLHFLEGGHWPLLFFSEELEAMVLAAHRYQTTRPPHDSVNSERCRAWMMAFFGELDILCQERNRATAERGARVLFPGGA